MKRSIRLSLLPFLFMLIIGVHAQDKKEVDHSYKPLKLNLSEDGSKYIRFIVWHQQWLQTNNLAAEDTKMQLNTFARRSRLLAFAQISPRFLILTHVGTNNLSANNMSALGNNNGDLNAPQFFLHDAWGEFKVAPGKEFFLGAGLHYWKGLTRLSNQSTLNMMTLDAPRPFVNWHSLGITDQFARHMGIYAKGTIGKFEYRMAFNNPMNPANSLGGGVSYSNPVQLVNENPEVLDQTTPTDYLYAGSTISNEDGDPTGNMIAEGYFQYSFFDGESDKLPYKVGTYLGKKKVFNIGAGYFFHPNGTFRVENVEPDGTLTGEHENVTHLALDAFLDMPLGDADCLNAYASFMNFNYGDNFVSRWAGTGTVFYGQLGYKLPNLPLMPYVSTQFANYDGYDETVSELNIGLNYYVNGHNAKLTLEYHQITNDLRERDISDFQDNNTLGQIRMQMHIFL